MRDLKPNGANILVTEENKKEYVHLVCQMKMTGEIMVTTLQIEFLFSNWAVIILSVTDKQVVAANNLHLQIL